MKHIHLERCNSTQKYLIEMTKDNAVDEVLVSCDFQSHGIGQRGNLWDCYTNSLCMSFVLIENEVLSLTALEIGVLTCDFFKSNYKNELFLKWPNDILNSKGQKVGGIIINKQGDKKPIIGVGLNLFPSKNDKLSSYDVEAGFIFNTELNMAKEKLAKSFYQFILANRHNSEIVIKKWNDLCIHIGKDVQIHNDNKTQDGVFEGIGKYGQALIKHEGKTIEYYTGSLRINN